MLPSLPEFLEACQNRWQAFRQLQYKGYQGPHTTAVIPVGFLAQLRGQLWQQLEVPLGLEVVIGIREVRGPNGDRQLETQTYQRLLNTAYRPNRIVVQATMQAYQPATLTISHVLMVG